MLDLTNPKWWFNMFLTTLLTMMFIFIIKKAFSVVDVPIVSNMVGEV